MATPPQILIAGESWTTHSIHQKGFDSFTTTEYVEGVGWLRAALGSRSQVQQRIELEQWDVHDRMSVRPGQF